MLYFQLVCMHLIELLFFIGLAGCFGVVLLSWISIFKSGFAPDHLRSTSPDLDLTPKTSRLDLTS